MGWRPRTSEHLSQHILQHRFVQIQLRYRLLQSAVFSLELFHLTSLIRLHTNVLLLPSVNGLLTGPLGLHRQEYIRGSYSSYRIDHVQDLLGTVQLHRHLERFDSFAEATRKDRCFHRSY
jgi:hypothetical protein